jgi:hypothetical protein
MTTETKAKERDELRLKVEAFCMFYTSLGEKTYGMKAASALAAGYSEASARNTATELLRDPAVQQRIKERNAANLSRNDITTDKVLQDLEHTRLLALEKGDLSTAFQCSAQHGKFLALWVDRTEFDEPKARLLDAQEQAEAAELARLRLKMKYGLLDGASPPKPAVAS